MNNEKLETENFKYNKVNYDWHELIRLKNDGCLAIFASAYFYNDMDNINIHSHNNWINIAVQT